MRLDGVRRSEKEFVRKENRSRAEDASGRSAVGVGTAGMNPFIESSSLVAFRGTRRWFRPSTAGILPEPHLEEKEQSHKATPVNALTEQINISRGAGESIAGGSHNP
jgi:hypothetical protein